MTCGGLRAAAAETAAAAKQRSSAVRSMATGKKKVMAQWRKLSAVCFCAAGRMQELRPRAQWAVSCRRNDTAGREREKKKKEERERESERSSEVPRSSSVFYSQAVRPPPRWTAATMAKEKATLRISLPTRRCCATTTACVREKERTGSRLLRPCAPRSFSSTLCEGAGAAAEQAGLLHPRTAQRCFPLRSARDTVAALLLLLLRSLPFFRLTFCHPSFAHFPCASHRRARPPLQNDKYAAAIAAAAASLPSEALTLDIGAGTGLLSMLAAKAGLTNIHACEVRTPCSAAPLGRTTCSALL